MRACPTDSSETYDPQTAVWTSAGNLGTPRLYNTQTSLAGGSALVAGGCGATCAIAVATAERFNPQSRTWLPAGQLQTSRYDHAAVLLKNGAVLVTGGQACSNSNCTVTATAEIYTPATNSWTSTTNMTTPRVGHTLTLLASGRVLAIGGCTMLGCPSASLVGAEIYDPVAQSWAPTTAMTLLRSDASATLLANGQVLVAGGLTSGNFQTAAAELFNPKTGSWTATGSMTTARDHPSATLLADGTVLAANGITPGGTQRATAELYIPASGLWVATGSPSTYNSTLTALSSTTVLVSGGLLAGQKTTGTSLLYVAGRAP